MDNTVKILIIIVVILVGVLAFAGSYILTGEDKNITNNQTNQTNITVNNTTEPSNAPDASARTVCTVWPCNGKGYWTCQNCDGTGKDPDTNQTCRGQQVPCDGGICYCPSCGGDGYIDSGDMGIPDMH